MEMRKLSFVVLAPKSIKESMCVFFVHGRYALKEVSIKALSHKERQDAVNEIRILASVNHSNVLR